MINLEKPFSSEIAVAQVWRSVGKSHICSCQTTKRQSLSWSQVKELLPLKIISRIPLFLRTYQDFLYYWRFLQQKLSDCDFQTMLDLHTIRGWAQVWKQEILNLVMISSRYSVPNCWFFNVVKRLQGYNVIENYLGDVLASIDLIAGMFYALQNVDAAHFQYLPYFFCANVFKYASKISKGGLGAQVWSLMGPC